jgi:hypothetical protein
MRSLVISTLAVALGASAACQANESDRATRAGDAETVQVWSVDMQGKPPYKRRLETLTVQDAASVETETDRGDRETRTVQVRTVDTTGKPPFKRRVETLAVSDAASLEVEADRVEGPKLRGRPPFNRHR